MVPITNPSASWPFMLLRALAAIAFGLIAFFMPGPTIGAIVMLFAAYMIADGIFDILAGVRAARQGGGGWGWFVLEGVLDIAVGVAVFLWPGLTVIVFVTLIAAWAILSGIVMLYGAYRFRQEHGRGWLIAGGIVSLAWGVLLLFAPMAGAVVMTLWLAAYALVFGIALLFLALRLRRESRQPLTTRPA
jgi:uncharacterized membrane protein HdeD (DUF308 family)